MSLDARGTCSPRALLGSHGAVVTPVLDRINIRCAKPHLGIVHGRRADVFPCSIGGMARRAV